MVMYEVKGFFKFSEEDIFNDGCQPNSRICFDDNTTFFSSDSIEKLITELKGFFGVDEKGNVELDCCDEPGRIDFVVMENEMGYPASKKEMDAWERGECKLWYVVYTVYVEEVDRKQVNLSDIYLR